MESVTSVQILNKTVCVLLCANVHGKAMNSDCPPHQNRYIGHIAFFTIGNATSPGEGKLYIQTSGTS